MTQEGAQGRCTHLWVIMDQGLDAFPPLFGLCSTSLDFEICGRQRDRNTCKSRLHSQDYIDLGVVIVTVQMTSI